MPQSATKPADAFDLADLEGLTLEQIERIVIQAAIKRNQGNVTRAAKDLAINPSTVYRKIEKWSAAAEQ